MPKQAEPQFLTRPNRAIVGAGRGERVGGSDERRGGGRETGDFVGKEGDVAFVALAVDGVGVELVSEAKDGEPMGSEVVSFRKQSRSEAVE